MDKLVKTCRSALFLFLFVVFTKLFLDVLQQDSLDQNVYSFPDIKYIDFVLTFLVSSKY